MSTTIVKVDQTGNGFPRHGSEKQMETEILASFVAERAVQMAVFAEALRPYYLELRQRFRHKKDTETIHNCRTWDDYCNTVLERTRRAVNYWLAGGNPVSKRKPKEKPTPTIGVISSSPIDTDPNWDKQESSRQIQKWSLSVLKHHTPEERRMIVEDVTAKLHDELAIVAPVKPPAVGDPASEPDAGTMEELRQRLARMADVVDIQRVIEEALAPIVRPLLEGHPFGLTLNSILGVSALSVRLRRPESEQQSVYGHYRKQWKIGDWVEGDDRKLGVITAKDKLERPRIRWYHDDKFEKERSNFHCSFTVLFDWQAAEKYPKAFAAWSS